MFFLQLDWQEAGFVSKDCFRSIAKFLGMLESTDEEWDISYIQFCGEYIFDPDRGVETAWLKEWINARGGEGYISSAKLHQYLFGVKPKTKRPNRTPPSVSVHPPDAVCKPISTV